MDYVYGIINKMNNQILYIGSTKDFEQRKSKHKSNLSRFEYPICKKINQLGGFDWIEFEIYEKTNGTNRTEREMFYQNKFQPKYSSHYAIKCPKRISEQQKKYKNRTEVKQRMAVKWQEYYEKNKIRLLEHQKIMRDIKKGSQSVDTYSS